MHGSLAGSFRRTDQLADLARLKLLLEGTSKYDPLSVFRGFTERFVDPIFRRIGNGSSTGDLG